jgi:trehalose 6-phosphate phosphatase
MTTFTTPGDLSAAVPVENHAMLADGWTVALLTPDATVTWFCHPTPDAGAVFAHLLGGPSAGYFSVRPLVAAGGGETPPLAQDYRAGTMTVETRWPGLVVTDWLAHVKRACRTDLVRRIRGTVPALVEFAPRPEFGAVSVRLDPEPDGLRVLGTSDPMVLRSPGVKWTITSEGSHQTARALVDPADGEVVLELRCGSNDLAAGPDDIGQRQRRDEQWWSEWLNGLRLPTVERGLVARSALLLRALCVQDTGAIMAAATTSLPEEIGGIRNWDYRFCWLRDAALTARTLVSLGSTDEAQQLLHWLHRVLRRVGQPERLHPLYTIRGDALGSETVIDTVSGYAGSRPVRVSNAANKQVQLDVFGPIMEMVVALAAAGQPLSARDRDLAHAMVEGVSRRWHEPDHGIWELRGPPRHHVYSKVMCWVTVQRASELLRSHGESVPAAWTELSDRISAQVQERGWNERVGAFTTAYGSDDLDAASLQVGLSGLLPPSDERFRRTVAAVEGGLRSGTTVYRYHLGDGLPGKEGGFHLCSAWLIESYLLCGQRTSAQELFAHLVAATGPTGLLPEEYDPVTGHGLGNVPQAYSHVALIRCAQLLSRTAPDALADERVSAGGALRVRASSDYGGATRAVGLPFAATSHPRPSAAGPEANKETTAQRRRKRSAI